MWALPMTGRPPTSAIDSRTDVGATLVANAGGAGESLTARSQLRFGRYAAVRDKSRSYSVSLGLMGALRERQFEQSARSDAA